MWPHKIKMQLHEIRGRPVMRASDAVCWKGRRSAGLLRLGSAPLLICLILSAAAQTAGHESSARKPTQKAGQPPGLCYAFLQRASLWTACEGRRERIELGARVNEFAVSPDGWKLVIQKQEQGTHSATSISSGGHLNIISLRDKTDTTVKVDPWGQLYTTCGTVVFFILLIRLPRMS